MSGTDLPRVADLAKLVSSLPDHPLKRKTREIVKRIETLQSCIADLTLALNICGTLEQFQGVQGLDAMHKSNIEHSLLTNACLLYARATATAGKKGSRGSVSIRERLSDTSKEDHDKIVAIRNRALAHVHSNEAIDQMTWHRSHAFAVEDENGGWLPAAAVRRIQSEPKTFSRLNSLIPQAMTALREKYDFQISCLVANLHKLEVPYQSFIDNSFDPVILFGSVEEAASALGGPRRGSRFGIISNN